MFYSYAARPLIPCESSLVAGVSAFPPGKFVLYKDSRDSGTNKDRIWYLNKQYTREMEKETDSYWRFERGSLVIFTNGEPYAGAPVYDANKNRTGYYVDKAEVDPNGEFFATYERAKTVWDTILTKNKLVSNRRRTEILTLTSGDATQIQKLNAFYWVRMTGRILAKETGEYTFGCSFGYGTTALNIGGTSAVSSTRNRDSGNITYFTKFLRQGYYDMDFFYKHMKSTDYNGYYTLLLKRPGEDSLSELRLDDLTTVGLR